MRTRWWPLAALALLACGEEEQTQIDEPEPIPPQVVSADGEEAEPPDDVAALQAGVAELGEQEDAVEPATPQSANIPDGVDAPEPGSDAEELDEDEEPEGSRGRRRRRADEPFIIDPLGLLLGE